MLQLMVAVLAGLLVAAAVIGWAARRAGPEPGPWDSSTNSARPGPAQPTPIGWASCGLGLATVAAVAIATVFRPRGVLSEAEGAARQFDPQSFYLVAFGTGIAALVTAVRAVRRGDRRWPAWCGLVCGALSVGGWVGAIVFILFHPY
ncbi:hypothetical protein [Granulicoccus sp. GXG6511]|uniref:hypothetical protein n=1 Tax=Granulicoccus sp. GXG6511 TaxID=3381351 RepID=UPI003D7DD730